MHHYELERWEIFLNSPYEVVSVWITFGCVQWKPFSPATRGPKVGDPVLLGRLAEAFKDSGSFQLPVPPVETCNFHPPGHRISLKSVFQTERDGRAKEKGELFVPFTRNKLAFLQAPASRFCLHPINSNWIPWPPLTKGIGLIRHIAGLH